MPRYELKDGKSNKFWEITVTGDTYVVRYGRIGTDGQTSTKVFSTNDEAQQAADKLAASKVKKGYQLIEGYETSEAPAKSEYQDLEEAIQIDPSNNEAWEIYGDALEAANDIHGELIALGIALEAGADKTKQKEIQSRIDEIMAQNAEAWLGRVSELGKYPKVFSAEWKCGYILKATVAYASEWEYEDDDFDFPDPSEMISAIIAGPAGKFLQELTIKTADGMEDGDMSFSSCIRAITSNGRQPALKKLIVGEFDSEECEISWSSIGDVSKLYAVCPNLEYLSLQAGDFELGKLKHNKLQTLLLETGGLSGKAVKSVASAELPELDTLVVWFGDENYGAGGKISMLKPLFEGKGYPKLKHLGLCNAEFENEIAQQVVSAPILKQLQSLDLSMGTMTDEGAKALVDFADSLQHLDEIDVSDNFISNDMCDQLKKALGGKIKGLDDQEEPDEWDGEVHTYVSVSE